MPHERPHRYARTDPAATTHWSSPAVRYGRASWSAPASTRISPRRARRSTPRAPQIVTVAIRRTNIGQNAGEPSLLDHLPPSQFTLLPNTAGCYSADDAVRTLKLARELLDGHKLVKLEVLGDPQTLVPERARNDEGRRDCWSRTVST